MFLNSSARWLIKAKQLHPSLGVRSALKWRSVCSLYPLEDRSIVELSGPDAAKLLQGLITNDIRTLDGGVDKSIAAAFLTTKGRCFTDAIITAVIDDSGNGATEQSYLVDCPEAHRAELLRHLKRYKLRSKVQIKDRSPHLEVVAAAAAAAEEEEGGAAAAAAAAALRGLPGARGAAADPRLPALGARAAVPRGNHFSYQIYQSVGGYRVGPFSEFTALRLRHCVPEGLELVNRIPLECSLELLHFISFTKGCYIGQELTARSFFKGTVRKRLFPFVTVPRQTPPSGSSGAPLRPLTTTNNLLSAAVADTASVAALRGEARGAAGGRGSLCLVGPEGTGAGEVVAYHASGLGLAMLRLDRALWPKEGKGDGPLPWDLGLGELGAAEEGKTVAPATAAAVRRRAPGLQAVPFAPGWLPRLDPATGKEAAAAAEGSA